MPIPTTFINVEEFMQSAGIRLVLRAIYIFLIEAAEKAIYRCFVDTSLGSQR
jgi:hypothetical protein